MCLQTLKNFARDTEAKMQDRKDMSMSDQMKHEARRDILLKCATCPNATVDCDLTPKAEYEVTHFGPTESVIRYNFAKEMRTHAV